MSYHKKLQEMIVLTLIVLLLVACSAPSNIKGTLTNQATGEPLAGALVILCQSSDEKTCVINSTLTALTDNEGKFHIADVEKGEYIVLYNGSGEKQSAWEGMKIDFTPLPLIETDPALIAAKFPGVYSDLWGSSI
ncbi:MAG: carboxypeptidase regulatory-like domain-containing protein [Anaerolineales bacterium]|nr:carboxypeptidase regulatory-like domain-containing protein [Anaerolineales bacterium]